MRRVMIRMDDDLYDRVSRTAHYRFKSMNAWLVDLAEDHAFSDEVLAYRAKRDAEKQN